jgi:hypothetical protein
MKWHSNPNLLIQGAHTMPQFIDMNRLTYQRHAAYCMAQGFDYWHFIGHPCPERERGGWDKVAYIKRALEDGYQFIAWLDTDTAIIGNEPLTKALPDDMHIGGCLHDGNTERDIPPHINVGVLYLRNTPETCAFVDAWEASYPGEERWVEQGSFNTLAQETGIVSVIDDKWNSTVGMNEVPDPVVMAWHGVWPIPLRLEMMRGYLRDDYLRYRV